MCRILSCQEYRENFLKKANNLTSSQRTTVTGTEIFRTDFLYPAVFIHITKPFLCLKVKALRGKNLLLT